MPPHSIKSPAAMGRMDDPMVWTGAVGAVMPKMPWMEKSGVGAPLIASAASDSDEASTERPRSKSAMDGDDGQSGFGMRW